MADFACKQSESSVPGIVHLKEVDKSIMKMKKTEVNVNKAFGHLSEKEKNDLVYLRNNSHINFPNKSEKNILQNPITVDKNTDSNKVEGQTSDQNISMSRKNKDISAQNDTSSNSFQSCTRKVQHCKVKTFDKYTLVCVESCNSFYLRNLEQEQMHMSMSSKLQTTRLNKVIYYKDAVPYKVYIAKIEDNLLRVVLKEEPNEKSSWCEVVFVDNGTSDQVLWDHIFHLPANFANIPPLIDKFSLKNVHTKKLTAKEKDRLKGWLIQHLPKQNIKVKFFANKVKHSEKPLYRNFVEIFTESGESLNEMANREIKRMKKIFTESEENLSKLATKEINRMKKDCQLNRNHRTMNSVENNYTMWPNNNSARMRAPYPQYPLYQNSGANIPAPYLRNPSSFQSLEIKRPLLRAPLVSPSFNANDNIKEYNPNQSMEEKERLIAVLQGQIKSYITALDGANQRTMFSSIKEAMGKLEPLLDKRKVVSGFIDGQCAAMRALNSLLNDKMFHLKVDNIVQICREMSKPHMNKLHIKKYIERLTLLLHDFEVLSATKSLFIMLDKVKESECETFYSKDHLGNYRYNGDIVPSYAEMANSFLHWKEEYLKCRLDTDAAVKEIAGFYTNLGSHLFSFLEGNETKGNFDFEKFNFKSIEKTCEREKQALNKGITEKLQIAVIEELENRTSKIKEITHCLTKYDLIPRQSEDSSGRSSPESLIEGGYEYPSLLKYIEQSKYMKTDTRKLVIYDITEEVCQIHSEGQVYKYINPQNILMKEGATLQKYSLKQNFEPLLPWTFIAPEPESSINTKGDSYSLGKLMLWLSCLDCDRETEKRIQQYKATVPLLSNILHEEPKMRPSVREIRDNLDRMLPVLFGLDDAEENMSSVTCTTECPLIANDNSESDYTKGVRLLSVTNSRSSRKTSEEEVEEMLRGMMDSDSEED